jgi:hypothetical protein
MTTKSKTPATAVDAGIILMRLSGEREQIEQQIRDQVNVVLALGGSWRTVGVALGVSGQAAWERYRASWLLSQPSDT